MGILNKIKFKAGGSSSVEDHEFPPASAPQPLSSALIPRYRKQRGVNLGSWFSLERWICNDVFREAAHPGKSDYDVASGGNAKQILEEHWDTWITDQDFQWIASKGFNSVRIPVGYYHLCAAIPDVIKGTDFEPFQTVFEGAWPRIQDAIASAGRHGLGVLIDLHAAAGAQNGDAHSGLSTGKINLWSSSSNLKSTSLALRFLSSTLGTVPNVIGLELLNEPQNNAKLQGWYESTVPACRKLAGDDFAIYISDAWDTQHYASWVGRRDEWVVLDHHLYRCFTDEDKHLSGEQHAQKLISDFQGNFATQSQAAKGNLVVAEWSASLDSQSLSACSDDGARDKQRREFVRSELELLEKHTAGWWYWTYKKGDGWDAGWSAQNAIQAEILPHWVGTGNFKGIPDADVKDHELQTAHNEHKSYWQTHGGSPDPAVFAPGFSQGWDDALMFLSDSSGSSGPSELGFIGQWSKRRKVEYESGNKALGDAAWEWEHGFEQGVQACKMACTG